jgi:hypothetical protein
MAVGAPAGPARESSRPALMACVFAFQIAREKSVVAMAAEERAQGSASKG